MSIPEDISTTNLNVVTTTATAAENMVIDETKEKPAPVEITEGMCVPSLRLLFTLLFLVCHITSVYNCRFFYYARTSSCS